MSLCERSGLGGVKGGSPVGFNEGGDRRRNLELALILKGEVKKASLRWDGELGGDSLIAGSRRGGGSGVRGPPEEVEAEEEGEGGC